MYEVKRFKSQEKYRRDWVWVRISKKEAAALISSLSAQLEAGDPNTGRIETQWTDKERGEGSIAKGFFTICVQDPLVCHQCEAKIEPYKGHKYFDTLICGKCHKKVCPYCRHIIHTSYCSKPVRDMVKKLRK